MRLTFCSLISLLALALTACGQILHSSSVDVAGNATPVPASLTAAQVPGPTEEGSPTPTLLPQESPPAGAGEFKTDFSKHSVPYGEILSGGPPKDGIPAIDHPKFVSVNEADSWLKPR